MLTAPATLASSSTSGATTSPRTPFRARPSTAVNRLVDRPSCDEAAYLLIPTGGGLDGSRTSAAAVAVIVACI